jgi:ABC-type transporter Mla MlaB component
MFSMTTRTDPSGRLRLALSGSVNADVLPEINEFVDHGRHCSEKVELDLSEVTLIDRMAARFFARQLRSGVELIDCPSYLKHWILRESTYER